MPAPKLCFRCQQPLTAGNIRTAYWTDIRVHVCKLCFLKLPKEDRRHSKREGQLVNEVTYSQPELPF